jgi:hypothetical protein
LASTARAKDKKQFFGWYDLGGVSRSPILASRRAQYRNRFVLVKNTKLAIDDGFITFIPKQQLSEIQLAAILASLNSDIGRFFIEIYGRSTGGGVIELDDKSAGKIPILNIDKLSKEKTENLGNLFEKLENETRQIGEAETQNSIEKLQPIIDEINAEIACILDVDLTLFKKMKAITEFFYKRRISRIEDAQPETVKGEEEPRINPPKRTKQQKPNLNKQLTKWIEEKK